MLTVEFDDEMILDEMLVSYYSQRPTTVYHRFHKEYNGEMVMEYSRKLGLPKKVLNNISKRLHICVDLFTKTPHDIFCHGAFSF